MQPSMSHGPSIFDNFKWNLERVCDGSAGMERLAVWRWLLYACLEGHIFCVWNHCDHSSGKLESASDPFNLVILNTGYLGGPVHACGQNMSNTWIRPSLLVHWCPFILDMLTSSNGVSLKWDTLNHFPLKMTNFGWVWPEKWCRPEVTTMFTRCAVGVASCSRVCCWDLVVCCALTWPDWRDHITASELHKPRQTATQNHNEM